MKTKEILTLVMFSAITGYYANRVRVDTFLFCLFVGWLVALNRRNREESLSSAEDDVRKQRSSAEETFSVPLTMPLSAERNRRSS
jgi:hypothetical protein